VTGPILYGRATSANVQKPLWALVELGVAFERIDVGGKHGGTDTPDYIAMNPNQRVPTLRDGDLVVWESTAIMRYVAAKYGAGRLWVDDPAKRAIVDQWTDWAISTFQPAWMAVFRAAAITMEAYRDQAVIRAAVDAAEQQFVIMDGRLQQTPWLGGDEFSYADIACGVRHAPMDDHGHRTQELRRR